MMCHKTRAHWVRAGEEMCVTMRFLEHVALALNSYLLVVIAVDRLYALSHPLKVCRFY